VSTFTQLDHWFSMDMMASAEDPMLASGPVGMGASTLVSAWPSRRSLSFSSASRRHRRSACRCGGTTIGPYKGLHYQLAATFSSSSPISFPRRRVLVGGGGERKALRFVARDADASNLLGSSPDETDHKLEVTFVAHASDY
jgi:hypothetical protein